MAYTTTNFTTKKELIAAVNNGEEVTVFNPGIRNTLNMNGNFIIEGPHYPDKHQWSATALIVDGIICRIT